MPRIPLVDDELSIKRIVEQALERDGFEIEYAPDGRSAQELFAQRRPDLVILDIMLPMAYTDRPEYCLSCHVMEDSYESWFHSSHREWATCRDCHVPHQNLVAKLAGKAADGMRDLYMFYTNQIPDPILLSNRGSRIVQENCLRCHGTIMANVNMENRN
ncbi:MAG: NapC/NirT family cytochrome c [Thermoanaerobacteraceae bacterium]|uniref:NapC/NirT family cytochrome c n=1 Tax=Thermanaeromonas sp. C210 TaxID=2731925 RepID=UPI00155BC184|nr:NapC/NirT family cytochrome c [Thermanaeromonas sp. C210]MBE3580298.1 NapC/NirT family cytochrome c [Thermoanaerobacteraceae bacterium]GFN22870.1 hypothetical protein TAMC210_11870 [Thermanaeromonas sp. C210]